MSFVPAAGTLSDMSPIDFLRDMPFATGAEELCDMSPVLDELLCLLPCLDELADAVSPVLGEAVGASEPAAFSLLDDRETVPFSLLDDRETVTFSLLDDREPGALSSAMAGKLVVAASDASPVPPGGTAGASLLGLLPGVWRSRISSSVKLLCFSLLDKRERGDMSSTSSDCTLLKGVLRSRISSSVSRLGVLSVAATPFFSPRVTFLAIASSRSTILGIHVTSPPVPSIAISSSWP